MIGVTSGDPPTQAESALADSEKLWLRLTVAHIFARNFMN
jgi:hypothetical protein